MKNKFLIITFLVLIYGFMIASIILPDKEISEKEKRYLKEFPSFSLTNTYAQELEDYLLDQFPLRDNFCTLKAYYNYNIMRKKENNDLILKNKGIYKILYPTNYKSIDNYLTYINSIQKLLTKNNQTFLLLVPDKNYYVSKDVLSIDYNYIYKQIESLNLSLIDIRHTLISDDYYLTDTHWKQEKLDQVLDQVLAALKLEKQSLTYTQNKYANFKGTYYGEAAINNQKDTLIYLTNDLINNVQVNYLENKELHTVYNLAKLNSFDSYEVYLDGASSFIEIINPACKRDKELVIFRDSFASSFTPLLIPYYSKITIIDNRYIGSKYFQELITFTNQDILFLNSTLLVNESFALKK